MSVVTSIPYAQVHRTMLSRDASMFGTMFALPIPTADNAEGSSDDNPVYLAGDTVTEFRNLLWALYALSVSMTATASPTKRDELSLPQAA